MVVVWRAPGGNRTPGLKIRNLLLCPLSYGRGTPADRPGVDHLRERAVCPSDGPGARGWYGYTTAVPRG